MQPDSSPEISASSRNPSQLVNKCTNQIKVAHYPGTEVSFEASETLPATEAWGAKGWTFPTEGGARVKFAEISPKIGHREAGNGNVATEHRP